MFTPLLPPHLHVVWNVVKHNKSRMCLKELNDSRRNDVGEKRIQDIFRDIGMGYPPRNIKLS